MRTGPAVILIAFAVVLQTIAGPLYQIGGVAPDFPFLALAYLALFAQQRKILALGGIAAIAIDVISLDPIGTRLAGYLPALWLLGRVRRTLWAEVPVFRSVATLGACIVAFGMEAAFLAWKEGRWPDPGFEAECVLYTALIGVCVHAALDGYRSRLGWVRDRFFA
jgi:rod shape-determining protein MreD